MKDHEPQFDADPDNQVTEAFAQDLKRLYQSPGAIPESIDQVILGNTRIPSGRPTRIRIYRAITGAAALIGIVIGLLVLGQMNKNVSTREYSGTDSLARTDIDQNGTVNILDAFSLARHIEAQQPLSPTWDLNADSRVDQADVDLVAYTAVRVRTREIL